MQLRADLLDEEDPPPNDVLQPPALIETDDPDEMLLHRVAYAAQVSVLDGAVSGLLSVLDGLPCASSTLVVVLGSRGFALGEHGRIGAQCDRLHSELLHVPCIVSAPGQHVPRRISRLLQPFDLRAVLSDWFAPLPGAAAPPDCPDSAGAELSLACRDWAISRNQEGEYALRTPAWLMQGGVGDEPRLYVKPDDRWESNEIASLRREIVEQLQGVYDSRGDWSPTDSGEVARLDRTLVEPER